MHAFKFNFISQSKVIINYHLSLKHLILTSLLRINKLFLASSYKNNIKVSVKSNKEPILHEAIQLKRILLAKSDKNAFCNSSTQSTLYLIEYATHPVEKTV